MQTCKFSWIMGSITCLTIAGCGDVPGASFAVASDPTVAEALRPLSDAAAVRAASQVEFNAIELARLALHRTHSSEVAAFAQKMLDDHTRNRMVLRSAAGRRGLKVVTCLDGAGQTAWSALFVKSGQIFDAAFSDAVARLQADGQKGVDELRTRALSDEIGTWCDQAEATWKRESEALAAL